MGTATQTDDSSGHGGMTRRELFRRTGSIGAGAAATVTVGSRVAPRFSPIGRAAAIAPALPIGIAAGGAAVAYFSGDSLPFTGDDRDYSGYTGADALHQEIAVGAREMQSADERVMTGIENNIQNADNVALPKGKNATIEKMNAEAPESEAQTAMQNAIDDYFSTIEENIITHYTAQVDQLRHQANRIDEHSNLSIGSVIEVESYDAGDWHPATNSSLAVEVVAYDIATDSSENSASVSTDRVSYTLLNGDTVSDVPVATSSNSNYRELYPHDSLADSGNGPAAVRVVDPDGNTIQHVDVERYQSAIDAVHSQRDSANATLAGFVSDVYSAYEPGDIPTEDLVDPITAATEMNQDYDDRGLRSAQAAILGIPTDANFTAQLEIVSEDAEDGVWEVEGDIFTSHTPRALITDSASISSGTLTLTTEPPETTTVTTTDGETVDVSAADLTESDGQWTADISGSLDTPDTSVDTALGGETDFEVGRTYQPSTWDAPLYIAYSYVDENSGEETADFTQIESETTVTSVTDVNGEEVQTFSTESQNNQTADVASLEEELKQLREAQVKMQNEAEEETEDDLGLPPVFDGGGGGILLIGAAVLAFLGLSDNSPI